MIADERAAEHFTAPGDEIERLGYALSVLHCRAVDILDEDSAGTRTVLWLATVRAYATEAGFGRVECWRARTTSGASTGSCPENV